MSIGSTIKRLRRERDITQEQLAEDLGITSRAVSQWECEKTAPDISQLPALCHIFGVSADVLLGINVEKTNEAIKEYLDRARDAEHRGQFEESAEILREAIRKFPTSYPIMQRLANTLVRVYSRKGCKDYDEVFDLCRRVLAECTDSTVRYEATQTLGIAYGYAGKTDEMRALAKEMPRAHFSYENFMIYRWHGDADLAEFQEYLSYLIYLTASMLERAAHQRHDDKTFVYSPEDRARLWETEVALLELLFPDGDYQYKAQLGEIACRFLCSAYLTEQKYEEAFHWLQKGADFAIHMDTYDFDAPHTSPVLRGYSDGGWIMEAEGNRTQAMLDWLHENREFEALRGDPRYGEIASRLQKSAKKP